MKSRLLPRPARLLTGRRIATAAVAVAAACVGVLASPVAAGAATPGYVLQPGLAGMTPLGLSAYVDPSAHDHASMYAYTKAAVADLAHYGVHITFRGYAKHAKLSDGVVQVVETSGTCQRQGNYLRLGLTTPAYYTLVNKQKVLAAATVAICPSLFGKTYPATKRTELFHHEMGHAVGLDHFNSKYGGHYQTMHATLTGAAKYQAGDINGLRAIVGAASRVHAFMYPVAHLDSVKRSSKTSALVTGWGFLSASTGTQVYYSVSEGGKVLGYIYNKVNRPDVNSHYRITGTHGLSWNIPSDAHAHTYCVKATVSSGYVEATNLGCVAVPAA